MVNVDVVTPTILARFLSSGVSCRRRDGKEKAQGTVNALRSSLRTFFAFLCSAGYLPSNPARLISLAHCQSAPPRALNDAEVERLLAVLVERCCYVGHRDRVLVRLLLAVGLRIGAALKLKKGDVCPESESILVTKGKCGRQDRFHVPVDVVEDLMSLAEIHGGETIFARRDGQSLSTRHAQRRFQLIAEAAGLRAGASLHSLRHTFATRLLAVARDIALVQSALGHASVGSTLIYARVRDGRVQRSVQASWRMLMEEHTT